MGKHARGDQGGGGDSAGMLEAAESITASGKLFLNYSRRRARMRGEEGENEEGGRRVRCSSLLDAGRFGRRETCTERR